MNPVLSISRLVYGTVVILMQDMSEVCNVMCSCRRLPVVQGASMAFFAPVFAIMSLPQWQCPSNPVDLNVTTPANYSEDEVWMSRMREVRLTQYYMRVIGLYSCINS